jgi:hypothetical protein
MIDFIILGAQKAATSALQAGLRMHPKVFMPEGESPFFEDPDYDKSPWVTFATDKGTDILKGIKRPDYLCSDTAIRRIADTLPECKFIVVLREPISRAISSYCYMVRHAHLPAKPLNEGMKECIIAYEQGKNNRSASVITYGLYGEYLNKWFQTYSQSRFLVISQEQVRDELKQVLLKCAEHLGLTICQKSFGIFEQKDSNVGLYDPELLKLARLASLIKTRPLSGSERRIPRVFPMRLLGSTISQSVEYIGRKINQNKETLNEEISSRLFQIYQQDTVLLKELAVTSDFSWIKR